MRRLLTALRGGPTAEGGAARGPTHPGPRTAVRDVGRPRSGNGASSFHLWWELPTSEPLVEVSTVLEIVTPPIVPDLYFWALQVGFTDGRRSRGGAHTGLQWDRRFPGGTAANWGGYASPEDGGLVLEGSDSTLPGVPGEANTRAYPWVAGRPYRLRVRRSPERERAWRAEVTDVSGGSTVAIRDLFISAPYLAAPVVWSEVFAACDAPSVVVRWSGLQAINASDAVVRPHAVRVTYQSHELGGCTNTTAAANGALFQITNAERTVPHHAILPADA